MEDFLSGSAQDDFFEKLLKYCERVETLPEQFRQPEHAHAQQYQAGTYQPGGFRFTNLPQNSHHRHLIYDAEN